MRTWSLRLMVGLALAGIAAAAHAHGGPFHDTLMQLHGH